MHLSLLDQLANNGQSFFHKSSPIVKIILTIVLITTIIVARSIYHQIGIIAIIVGFFMIAKLPLLSIGHLCLIPVFFSTFFALFEMQSSLVSGFMLIFRGVGSALAMLLLITTTSYTEVFAFLGLWMPRLLVDLLLFTYRSFFILLDRVGNLLKSIKLRGGLRPFSFVANMRSLAAMAAVLLLFSFEMGERMYKIYSLRGYNGTIPISFKFALNGLGDVLILLFSIFLLFGVLFI